ncbi:MAG: DUF4058 family protein [Hormoscilla sp.]
MPSPFPGMDPYLEHPDLWPGVHHFLITASAQSLSPQLRPKYVVSVEVRMYETSDEEYLLDSQKTVAVATDPTEPIKVMLPVPITLRQGYLEIKEVATKKVVTSIEVLSPVNKIMGKGRDAYLTKREQILGSSTNFVEIDLRRSGKPMPIVNKGIKSDYRILVSRGQQRPQAYLYAFNLQNQIPSFPLPLRAEDTEPVISLRDLLTGIYDIGSYDLKLDYSQEPVPRLSPTDAAWANALLRQQGLR